MSLCSLQDGNTALHYAASGGEVKTVETLINFGIKLHQTNKVR